MRQSSSVNAWNNKDFSRKVSRRASRWRWNCGRRSKLMRNRGSGLKLRNRCVGWPRSKPKERGRRRKSRQRWQRIRSEGSWPSRRRKNEGCESSNRLFPRLLKLASK